MSTNPYAPPTAHVADVQAASASGAAPFFAVSVVKLAVLHVVSLGFYVLYWFYRNWKSIREREHSSISPGLRAFFALLFGYSCFSRIREHGATLGVNPPLAAGAYAFGWIVMNLLWYLPAPYKLVGVFSFVPLLPVQAYVNRINTVAAPDHDPNARFGALNWITVAVGGWLVVLMIIGVFHQTR